MAYGCQLTYSLITIVLIVLIDCCYVGVSETDCGIHYGTIDYWVRLRVPMEQALRLYKVTHLLYSMYRKLFFVFIDMFIRL